MKNKYDVYLTRGQILKVPKKSKVATETTHEITIEMDGNRLITLAFPVKTKEDLNRLNTLRQSLKHILKKFVDGLKGHYKVKDDLKM